MASASPRRRLTSETVAAIFHLLLSGGVFPSSCFKVSEGAVASLSCQYSVRRFGLSRVCWGRGCGTLWCSNILVQTDENGVISKAEDRYRLTGDVLDGQMDLDILDVRRSDSGPYCCRVDIDGLFNDKKVIMNLRVVKASINAPTTTTLSATTTSATPETEAPTSAVTRPMRRNWTTPRSTVISAAERAPASLSLQINVPVLSLSLSLTVLITLAGVFFSLAFKRGLRRPTWRRGCFSGEEVPHIIYEIRMRRPVQENIYTLD
ncbi:T-cell immunoglobulin and mucin domain-containing protein 4 [Stigmatopora nigra]